MTGLRSGRRWAETSATPSRSCATPSRACTNALAQLHNALARVRNALARVHNALALARVHNALARVRNAAARPHKTVALARESVAQARETAATPPFVRNSSQMSEERRRAARFQAPAGVEATIDGVAVQIVDLSTAGAGVEHETRFTLNAPRLRLRWQGKTVEIPLRVARSEIVGSRSSQLIYHTGIRFVSLDEAAEALITSITTGAPPPPPPAEPSPSEPATEPLEDSWVRSVQFFKDDDVDEDDLPYAQFRRTPSGWEKSYVASPAQPDDGFTIERNARDFDELQRTFDACDPDTRRMMQIALHEKLKQSGR